MFEKYSPMTLRNAIEFELQKTDDPKTAAIIAMKKLKENPEYYEDMKKTKDTSKLIKKVITNKLGHKQTVYVKTVEAEKEGWVNAIANMFGLKDRKQVMNKIEEDYRKNEIDKKYSLTWGSWKNHVSEYFDNKSKWDRFFAGKKEKKVKPKKSEKKAAKKTEKKVKKDGLKLSVMREIFKLYGGKVEEGGDNFDTMPESDFEKEYFSEDSKIPIEIYEKAKKEAEKSMINNEEYQELLKLDKDKTIGQGIYGSTKEAEKAHAIFLKEEIKIAEKLVSDYEKKADIKIAKEINKATPDTRNKTEREIVGIPKPPPIEDIETPKTSFSPKDSTWTIPFYKSKDPETVKTKDYTGIVPKDVYIVSPKNILTNKKPDYIPEIDEEFLEYSKYFVPTMKLSEDRYIMLTHRERRRGTSQPVLGENKYAVVTRDVFAATVDYYFKLAKAKRKKEDEEYIEKTGRKLHRKRMSMISVNKMSYTQSNFIYDFTGDNRNVWKEYGEIRSDLKQKISDMEIQIEEYYNTHAKGQETAYGDKGLNDNLLNDYGIKVKRQNGSEINNTEIQEIKSAMDDVFSVFGNRKGMAEKFGLKVSHAGEKRMHARKAAGLFIPSMKAIGVTAKYGDKGTGFILAHEWGHFMDYYVGENSDRHYVSDNPNNIAGEIADVFRKNMTKLQKSAYQNRTCECFARSMEQYWAIKTDNKELMEEWDSGNHPTEEVFKERLMPLIDKFLKENENLLKAIFKIDNKFYRRAI